jgi:hypothetical protein
MKATQFSLSVDKSKEILSLAAIGYDRELPGLPSWVLDFSAAWLLARPFGLELTYFEGFDVGNSEGLGHFSSSPVCEGDTLTLTAIKIDVVSPMTDISNARHHSEIYKWVASTMDIFSTSIYRHGSYDDTESWWRSLLGDQILGTPKPGWQHVEVWMGLGIIMRYIEARQKDSTVTLEDSSGIHNFKNQDMDQHLARLLRLTALWRTLLECISTRRYCGTTNGDMGLMPKYAAIGDIICVYPGVKVPFVVRFNPPTEDGIQTYALVGECYVHGIMRGQRKEWADSETVTLF